MVPRPGPHVLVPAVFVIAWSSGFVGAALADDAAAPQPLLAWRYQLTAGLLLAVTALRRRTRRQLRSLSARELGEQVVLGLLAHAVFLGGVFLAAHAGLSASISALVCSLQPLLVAGGAALWFGDRLSAPGWLSLLLALAGVGIGVGGAGGSTSRLWLVLLALLALCAASLLERAWQPGVPVLVSLAVQTSVAAVALTGYAAATTGLHLQVSARLGWALAWLVLLSGLAGYASFLWCLRRLGATVTSTLLYLTPAVTAGWAWAMFGQPVSGRQVVGFVVVLAGVALSVLHRPRSTGPSSAGPGSAGPGHRPASLTDTGR